MDIEIEMNGEMGPFFAALSKTQSAIKGALRDSTNPHFKSKYADLESTWDACRAQLGGNGFAVVQTPFSEGENIGVVTVLGHTSGAWVKGRLAVKPMKFDAQGAGSAITYLRRYALAAMVGVSPTDDDGNAAVGQSVAAQSNDNTPISAEQKEQLVNLIRETGADTAKLLSYVFPRSNIKALDDVPAWRFPDVLNALEKKRSGAK